MTVTTTDVVKELGAVLEGDVVPGEVNVAYSDGTEQIRGIDPYVREIALQVQAWAQSTGERSVGSMIDRRKWDPSENTFAHIQQAKHILATNDLVAGFQETEEAMAFQGVKWESATADYGDLWNQLAAEQNLDAAIRKMYRELWTTSQFITATWWDQGQFTARGKTKSGNARKKRFDIWYPRIISILDSARVVPVGMLAFGQEMLAWVADEQEMAAFEASLSGDPTLATDEILQRFFVGKYSSNQLERIELAKLGIDPDKLILLNPELVKRHTLTRSDYERFAPVRLRSIFQLHDMRQQLMEADRVALVGAANYILLVKKGDKDTPAVQEEVNNVRANFRTLAKVPVIFSDHRLSIEIITPKQDFTLAAEKYDMLDARIIQRLINTVAASRHGDGAASDTPVSKTVVRVLENQRHMIRRYLENVLARDVIKHPRNADLFKDDDHAPSMVYTPANLSLDDATAMAAQIVALRTMREISRESLLEYFGFDQEAEALRLIIEEAEFDDTFKSQVPFSSPGQGGEQPPAEGETPPVAQGGAGAQGGRPAGGGQPSKNPTKTARTPKGTTPVKKD